MTWVGLTGSFLYTYLFFLSFWLVVFSLVLYTYGCLCRALVLMFFLSVYAMIYPITTGNKGCVFGAVTTPLPSNFQGVHSQTLAVGELASDSLEPRIMVEIIVMNISGRDCSDEVI
jgi:cellulose synthase/poly-beta-1,6-N-acetylglucosamine synthase-like glycosyltransferase